jgi:hypothetical protein
MKKTHLFTVLFVVLSLLAACAPKEAASNDEAVLTVNDKSYTQADLEALGTTSADYTDKEGNITTYQGVLLSTLLSDSGAGTGTDITFSASDGYETNLTVDEAMACPNCIIAFDNGTLRTVMPDMSSKLQVKDVITIITN